MLTVTPVESADDAGGSEAGTATAVAWLSCVPPDGQALPFTWVGLHTKKVMVPVGVPSPEWVAWTVAWSVTVDPKVVVPPEPTDGAVTVVVGICPTVNPSPAPGAPPNSARAAGKGVPPGHVARK